MTPKERYVAGVTDALSAMREGVPAPRAARHPDPRDAAIASAAIGVGATACAVVLAAVSVKLVVGLFS